MFATKVKNEVTYNSKVILQEQSKFYDKLYTSNKNVAFAYEAENIPKVSEDQKQLLSTEITVEEIGVAIRDMPRNKTPGSDGIPADFYKLFFIKMKWMLLKLFQQCYKNSRLHNSACMGVITLIPKKDRDLLLIKNWQPITLLCCDYKIISKVISSRVKLTLDNVINEQQKAFIQGRNIAHNIRKTLDIQDIVRSEGLAAVMIAIDFEKAFDKIEHRSMLEAFKIFNFPEYVVHWIRILFTDMRLSTINNGYTSPSFLPSRGLYQGNPIGPYAFIILVELLAINLRANKEIKGIQLGKVNYLLSMFADDLNLFMHFEQQSWQAALNEFTKFSEISGLQINYEKTTVYRMGSIRFSNAKFYSSRKLNWTNDPIPNLGIIIAHHRKMLLQENYDPILDRVKVLLDVWNKRHLSLFGKITILNALVVSLFVYKLQVLPSPTELFFQNRLKS